MPEKYQKVFQWETIVKCPIYVHGGVQILDTIVYG